MEKTISIKDKRVKVVLFLLTMGVLLALYTMSSKTVFLPFKLDNNAIVYQKGTFYPAARVLPSDNANSIIPIVATNNSFRITDFTSNYSVYQNATHCSMNELFYNASRHNVSSVNIQIGRAPNGSIESYVFITSAVSGGTVYSLIACNSFYQNHNYVNSTRHN